MMYQTEWDPELTQWHLWIGGQSSFGAYNWIDGSVVPMGIGNGDWNKWTSILHATQQYMSLQCFSDNPCEWRTTGATESIIGICQATTY